MPSSLSSGMVCEASRDGMPRMTIAMSMVTSVRDSGRCSSGSRRFSPTLPGTSPALAITPSRSPYASSHFTAVFGPTFGTPGTLSTLSPISAR